MSPPGYRWFELAHLVELPGAIGSRSEGAEQDKRIRCVTQAAVRYAAGHSNLGQFIEEIVEVAALRSPAQPLPVPTGAGWGYLDSEGNFWPAEPLAPASPAAEQEERERLADWLEGIAAEPNSFDSVQQRWLRTAARLLRPALATLILYRRSPVPGDPNRDLGDLLRELLLVALDHAPDRDRATADELDAAELATAVDTPDDDPNDDIPF